MKSPVYWHPLLYQLAMRMLYGRFFIERYTAIADCIPEGVSVHEVCVGDGYFYRHFLRHKKITYSASDLNGGFVTSMIRKGVSCKQLNLKTDPVPHADYIVMMASLYQFMPDHKTVVDTLLAATRKRLIITEPVVNLATSGNPLLRVIGQIGVNPGSGHAAGRFTPATIDSFMHTHYQQHIETKTATAGGREKIFVLKL